MSENQSFDFLKIVVQGSIIPRPSHQFFLRKRKKIEQCSVMANAFFQNGKNSSLQFFLIFKFFRICQNSILSSDSSIFLNCLFFYCHI